MYCAVDIFTNIYGSSQEIDTHEDNLSNIFGFELNFFLLNKNIRKKSRDAQAIQRQLTTPRAQRCRSIGLTLFLQQAQPIPHDPADPQEPDFDHQQTRSSPHLLAGSCQDDQA